MILTSKRLQSKGALREDAVYIERAADTILRRALLADEFCYVLAPRQIGKSSLRVNSARWLSRHHGIRCIHLDLTSIGRSDDTNSSHVSQRQSIQSGWYFGLIDQIASQLELEDPTSFYQRHAQLLPVHRFNRYLREEILLKIEGKIILFIDEIDYLRTLPFDTDEFFAAIRSIYDSRAETPEYQRLTFCLLGVAAPADLIKNSGITPFNIGQAVDLLDFSRQELDVLAPNMALGGQDIPAWLDGIYAWTMGHPYMTQFLCQKLMSEKRISQEFPSITEHISHCVEENFLRRGRTDDPSLLYAEKRLDGDENRPRRAELLSLYRRLREGSVVVLSRGDPLQLELMLCGMVSPYEQGGSWLLRVRNEIFSKVFNKEWLAAKETKRALFAALQKWVEVGRTPDALLRGKDLEESQTWVDANARETTAEEQEFVRKSLDNARREAEERQLASDAIAEREKRERAEERTSLQRRTISGLIVALIALLSGLAGISTLYFRLIKTQKQKNIAEHERSEAVAQFVKAKNDADLSQKLAEQRQKEARQEKATAEDAVARSQQARNEAEKAIAEARISQAIARRERLSAEEARKRADEKKKEAEEAQAEARRNENIARRLREETASEKRRAEKAERSATDILEKTRLKALAVAENCSPYSQKNITPPPEKLSKSECQHRLFAQQRYLIAQEELWKELYSTLSLAICPPSVRKFFDLVAKRCGEKICTADDYLNRAAIIADPRHQGNILEIMGSVPHVSIYPFVNLWNRSYVEFSMAQPSFPYEHNGTLDKLRQIADLPILRTTRFLIISPPFGFNSRYFPQSGETRNSEEENIIAATKRATWLAEQLVKFGVPENIIMKWIYNHKFRRSDIHDREDLPPSLGADARLSVGIWIFRTDCFFKND